jgi:MerR family transcriptional regulator, mercuric resistance operon regulatory protein
VLTGGEHRQYGSADVDRLLFIRGAQRLGMLAAMPGPGCPDPLPGIWCPPGLPPPEGR